MKPTRSQLARHARPRTRRRGVALIVAMMVLLMATATATFAIQNSGFELKSSGGAKQALQAKYVAESGVGAVMAFLEVKQGEGSLPTVLTGCTPSATMTDPYYLPQLCIGGVDSYCHMTCDDLFNEPEIQTNPLRRNDWEATNQQRGGAFFPSCDILLEYHCDQLAPTFGLLYVTANIFGRLELADGADFRTCDDNAAGWGANEDRNEFHSSISITRSYYTVNVTNCDLY